MRHSLLVGIICLGFLPICFADSEVSSKVSVPSLDHSSRSAEEKARDASRKPLETLAFFGLQADMKVIELFPGQGWYTKILAPYLEKHGQLYLAIGTNRIEPNLETFGFKKVQVTGDIVNFHKAALPGNIFDFDAIDLEQRDVDMVLTFRNAHNLNSNSRMLLNKAVYDALKPGGIYGVIDHTARHMSPLKSESWRRLDPVKIIKEALDSGFEFVAYSDIHARPYDDLKGDSNQDGFTHESDRFTLKFRKPIK